MLHRHGDDHRVILSVWRSLLPGLAQLWYRMKKSWRDFWPYKLLRLLLDISDAEKEQIALDLIRSRRCCFGQGGTLAQDLYDLAHSYPTETEQVAFLLGPWCIRLIHRWAIILSATIQDLECGNAKIKKTHKGGRPQKEATLSAKMLISESLNQHYQMHKQWPEDKFRSTLEVLEKRSSSRSIIAMDARKRKTSVYDVFRRSYSRSVSTMQDRSQLSVPLACVYNAEHRLDESLAYARLSTDMRATLKESAEIENLKNNVVRGASSDEVVALASRRGSSDIAPYVKPSAERFYKYQCAIGGVCVGGGREGGL